MLFFGQAVVPGSLNSHSTEEASSASVVMPAGLVTSRA